MRWHALCGCALSPLRAEERGADREALSARGCGSRVSAGKMQFLLLVLQLVQAVVNAALREKFLMSALFAQAAFVEHQNAVGVLNGAQAMRDHQRGAAGQQTVQRFANQQFRFGIHAGGSFVKNQEARIVRKGSRKINELALSNGKRGAALVDARWQFLRAAHEQNRPGRFRRWRVSTSSRVMPGVPRRMLDSIVPVKRNGSCKHDSEMPAKILQIEEADVDAIQQNLPALNVVETQQQGDQRGFAGAGVADNRESLARRNAEGHVAQHPVFVGGFAEHRDS